MRTKRINDEVNRSKDDINTHGFPLDEIYKAIDTVKSDMASRVLIVM